MGSIEKYETACEISEEESLKNDASESFEIDLNDVQTTLEAKDVDVQRKAFCCERGVDGNF